MSLGSTSEPLLQGRDPEIGVYMRACAIEELVLHLSSKRGNFCIFFPLNCLQQPSVDPSCPRCGLSMAAFVTEKPGGTDDLEFPQLIKRK